MVPAIATIDASRADPVRCSTSQGNATIEMPLPAPAISAAKRMTKSGPRLPLVMGYLQPNLTAAGPGRRRICVRRHSGTVKFAHPRTGRKFDSPVPAGSGWPGDPATRTTAVAETAAQVATMAEAAQSVEQIDAEVSVCRACPRLVEWRERVAVEKRKSFAGEPYWGRPSTGFGSARPRIMVVGLAPAAHGANRTGRV